MSHYSKNLTISSTTSQTVFTTKPKLPQHTPSKKPSQQCCQVLNGDTSHLVMSYLTHPTLSPTNTQNQYFNTQHHHIINLQYIYQHNLTHSQFHRDPTHCLPQFQANTSYYYHPAIVTSFTIPYMCVCNCS